MPGPGQRGSLDAESTVKAVQRRFATPVPRVADLRGAERPSPASALPAGTRARRAVALGVVPDPGSVRGGPRRGGAAAARSLRRLRDPSRGRRGQVPDGRAGHEPRQRPPASCLRDGLREGLRRPGSSWWAMLRGDHRVARAAVRTSGTRWCSTRSTTWRRSNAARRPWTTRRCTATGALPACFAECPAHALERQHGNVRRVASVRARLLQLMNEHPLTRVLEAVEHLLASRRGSRASRR